MKPAERQDPLTEHENSQLVATTMQTTKTNTLNPTANMKQIAA